jgi:hypothetical protein
VRGTDFSGFSACLPSGVFCQRTGLTNFVNRGEKLGAMPDDDYNLRRAEEHVAEARRLVLQQKGLITRLRAADIDTSNAERILKVLEKNLKAFEEYRDAL